MNPRTAAVIIISSLSAACSVCTGQSDTERLVDASIVPGHSAWMPGEINTVGVRFVIEDGWHIYWPGQNDTGIPPLVEWDLPAGWEIVGTAWPSPKRYISPGDILDHVFEDEVAMLVQIRVPKEAKGSRVTIRGSADWLVCREACIPEDQAIELSMPVARDTQATRPGPGHALIERTRGNLPKPLPKSQQDLRVSTVSDGVHLTPLGTFEWAAFYPAEDCVKLVNLIETGKVTARRLELHSASGPGRLKGIVEIHRGEDLPAVLYLIDEEIGG